MAKNLVIVESPSKATTIGKFLGPDYKVLSSKGHIRDLLKKDFSIDVDQGFMPIYEIPSDKKDLVKSLKKEADAAEMVWLASDEDREGEAIAWHLYETLGLTPEKSKRIVFHEITKQAILNAIANPRPIDINLVDAQQARRVLDRIVGFELSPVLWKKIKPALSAGRVQSVAVRLIVDREREIQNFESETYYRVVAQFKPEGGDVIVNAELSKRLNTLAEAERCLEACREAIFTVKDVSVKPQKKSPAPPFTTSTLQQEASRKLGFTVSQTMRVAQMLYESGHITYMRTDSVNLSSLAIGTIKKEITETLGEEYLKVRKYHTASKGAQEAHEAIRPTYISNHDISGTAQEKKLYNLIWKRTIASQMADAEVEKTTINIEMSNRDDWFVATGEVLKFDGFLRVYMESTDEESGADDDLRVLPPLRIGQSLSTDLVTATQRFTQQPYRYNEASLVKKLEELGIGRPSTYAPTISTIQQREYVVKGEKKGVERSYDVVELKKGKISKKVKTELTGAEKGKLLPTDTGTVVNDFLMQYFGSIMDYNFTAKVEGEFDDIAEGKVKWNKEIANFYKTFHPTIEEVSGLRLEHKVGERMLGNDPATGKPVSVKIGRFGPVVQIGKADDNERPRFASLQKNQTIDSITLEEALKLFELPRTLGTFEDVDVVVAVGRFGPYVKHGNSFVSIPKTLQPQTISIEEAIDLIEAKRKEEANKVLKTFAEDADMQVLNGRYGVYICYKGSNYKIPKGTDTDNLTLEQCRAIVADEANAPKKKATRGGATRKKAASKK
ncbi:MAG: type I DNA topoisomerase [Muribaculaceae bacterium]